MAKHPLPKSLRDFDLPSRGRLSGAWDATVRDSRDLNPPLEGGSKLREQLWGGVTEREEEEEGTPSRNR
jgi:hypothetical protein